MSKMVLPSCKRGLHSDFFQLSKTQKIGKFQFFRAYLGLPLNLFLLDCADINSSVNPAY